MHRPPPRLPRLLLERCLGLEHEAVVGDLEEEYHDHAEAYGRGRAAWLYALAVLRVVPVVTLTDLIWQSIMFKNYVLIALRNLCKHKGFSAINILGLAVSMSVCLLIITMVRDQASYDRFHERADRTYRVTSTVDESFGRFSMAT